MSHFRIYWKGLRQDGQEVEGESEFVYPKNIAIHLALAGDELGGIRPNGTPFVDHWIEESEGETSDWQPNRKMRR